VTWIIAVPQSTYRLSTGDDRREHFKAAETHLVFGPVDRPVVAREGDEPRYRVKVTPAAAAFSVVIRGNAILVAQLAEGADWSRLVTR
jgi:hypothetical protein